MSVEFVNELPRAARASGRAWTEEARALRGRPGQWALLTVKDTPQKAAAAARAINDGLIIAFKPEGTFEGASRTVDGEYRVYARHVGEQ